MAAAELVTVPESAVGTALGVVPGGRGEPVSVTVSDTTKDDGAALAAAPLGVGDALTAGGADSVNVTVGEPPAKVSEEVGDWVRSVVVPVGVAVPELVAVEVATEDAVRVDDDVATAVDVPTELPLEVPVRVDVALGVAERVPLADGAEDEVADEVGAEENDAV